MNNPIVSISWQMHHGGFTPVSLLFSKCVPLLILDNNSANYHYLLLLIIFCWVLWQVTMMWSYCLRCHLAQCCQKLRMLNRPYTHVADLQIIKIKEWFEYYFGWLEFICDWLQVDWNCKMGDWVHCNLCYCQPGQAKQFFLTNCGHTLCSDCAPPAG